MLKELLALQEKSFQSVMRLVTDDIRGELRVIRKELQDHEESVSFISNKYDDLKVKADNIETRLDAAFSQMKGMNKDINDSLDTLEDKQEYLENQSRRNNIKIFGVPEDEDEKSWDDTETVVKTLIRNKLEIQDEIEIERAYRVGKKIKPRPQSGGILNP